MHIYAFGSLCRGDVAPDSDVDLLAIVDGRDARFSADTFSIYSYRRIQQIWKDGNPFAWHLHLESKLLFSSDSGDFLATLGPPNIYDSCLRDCEKFHSLFRDACASITTEENTAVFDLSMVFLGIRNLATCFSLGYLETPDFSRYSALRLGDRSLCIREQEFRVLERARILCTRGVGVELSSEEKACAISRFSDIESWMAGLIEEVRRNAARVQ